MDKSSLPSPSILFIVAVWVSGFSLIWGQMPSNTETNPTANLWPYQANSSPSSGSPYGPANHQDYTLGQRQTSLASPLVSFLPMLVLFGIGAVIVISILYFIFNPFGLTSLLGPGALAGTPSYGRKRSLDGSKLQQYIMDLLNTVSNAIDKYEKVQATSPGKKS